MRNLTVRKFDPQNPGNMDECLICFDSYNENTSLVKLKCGHEFEEQCIKKWFKSNTRCPLCKQQQL
jgi:hypothetical protein